MPKLFELLEKLIGEYMIYLGEFWVSVKNYNRYTYKSLHNGINYVSPGSTNLRLEDGLGTGSEKDPHLYYMQFPIWREELGSKYIYYVNLTAFPEFWAFLPNNPGNIIKRFPEHITRVKEINNSFFTIKPLCDLCLRDV